MGVTFIDLFAGAGGFSEGFLQADGGARYDFLAASDINENCELTHLLRYNHQLGLDLPFLRSDVKAPDFVDRLSALVTRPVDVVCGGPPCQSFSLAGRRRKNDKKDDLFAGYLRVIERLRPKYFVMENVPGILTKDGGAHKERILREIGAMVDDRAVREVASKLGDGEEAWIRLRLTRDADGYATALGDAFRDATRTNLDYRTSKTSRDVATVRHGIRMLGRVSDLARLVDTITREKGHADIDNDAFVDEFDRFIDVLQPDAIVERCLEALKRLPAVDLAMPLRTALLTPAECLDRVAVLRPDLQRACADARLYRCADALTLDASDYGVPQRRKRVVFIGCRRDQKLIHEVPRRVAAGERVTVEEALWDLDFLQSGQASSEYRPVREAAVASRQADGRAGGDRTYAAWSRQGRVPGCRPAAYVYDREDYDAGKLTVAPLHNHQAATHNAKVTARLQAIMDAGRFEADTAADLAAMGLGTGKRDYTPLQANQPAPTIVTIPDDYVHYRVPRAPTVREMARLQSFDDSFVFQGKRTTGGNRRKDEVPQYTLVGNAVPPLLARAIGEEILKVIE